jgi:hypothetical protein
MIDQIVDFYRTIGRHNVLLSYQGAVSNDMILFLASIIENKSSLSPKMKRVFGVFLELAQNIMYYSAEVEPSSSEGKPIGKGKIMVTEHANAILVSAANAVAIDTANRMAAQIDELNQLSRDQQKAVFLEKRRKPLAADSTSTGLGIIDIARKSDQPLAYHFLPHEKEGYTYLLLVATLNK